MSAELIVVNGPLAGTRYDLLKGDIFIGRSPNSKIVLSEPEVGWRHCQIRQQGERFLVSDLRTSSGTYVNGMRSAERWLEDRDQIGIGRTILMFRSGAQPAEQLPVVTSDTKPVLLAACSLVFLFRALAGSTADGQGGLLQNQILRLVSDIIPVERGDIVLGATLNALLSQFERRVSDTDETIRAALSHICEEGAFEDSRSGLIGVPLYLANVLGGALLLRVKPSERDRLPAHLETLTAIASLASIGFEANREVETLQVEKALLQE